MARALLSSAPEEAHELAEGTLAAFVTAADCASEAGARYCIATALRRLGRAREGIPHLERVLDIVCDLGDTAGIGVVQHDLAMAHEYAGDARTALTLYAQALDHEQAQNNPSGVAAVLSSIGRAHRDLDELDQARTSFEAALELRIETGDRRGEGVTRSGLGGVLRELDEPEMARMHLKRALEIARERKDVRQQAIVLGELGLLLQAEGDIEAALAVLKEAVGCARESGDLPELAHKLSEFAAVLSGSGRPAEAVAALEEAIPLLEAVGQPIAAARRRLDAERPLVALGRRRRALELCEQARELFARLGRSEEQAVATLRCGELRRELGQPREAVAYAREAIGQLSRSKAPISLAGPHLQLGLALEIAGRPEEALEVLEHAAALGNGDDPVVEAQIATTLGRSLRLLGRLTEAKKASERAVKLTCGMVGSVALANARANLGRVEAALGNTGAALANFELALDCPDRLVATAARCSLADVLRRLHRYEEALSALDETAREARAIEAPQTLGVARDDTGAVLAELGRLAEARAAHTEAAEALGAAGDPQGEGAARHNAAFTSIRLGEPDQALPQLERALTLARETRDRAGEAACLHTLGLAREASGDPRAALGLLDEAITLARESGADGVALAALIAIARCHAVLADPEAAIARLRSGLGLFERLRFSAGTPGSREAVGLDLRPLFPMLVSLLVTRAQAAEPLARDELLAEALRVSELSRARGFFDALAERRAGLRGELSEELRAEETRLVDALRAALAEQQALRLAAARGVNAMEPERQNELAAAIRTAERGLRLLEARTRSEHPAYAALQTSEPRPLRQIQRELLADGPVAILEYIVGKESSHLFVVTSRTLEVLTLPAADELTALCLEQHRAIADGRDADCAALHQTLIAPALARLERDDLRRLIIVPDGALHLVPWAALAGPGEPALLERFTLQTTPSVAVALAMRTQTTAEPDPTHSCLLALGDPRGTTNDEDSFRRIPRSAQEVTEIARHFAPGAPRVDAADADPLAINFRSDDGAVVVLTGPHATREAFLAEVQLRAWRFVHLATHGFADLDRAEASGVIFSGVSPAQPAAYLRGFELAEIAVRCDLCVLSACETGLGRLLDGEGMVALWRAFAYAGARSVCASFWRINDASTAMLMSCLYRHLLSGSEPAEALQRAQLETRERYPHPYHWAGFQIVL